MNIYWERSDSLPIPTWTRKTFNIPDKIRNRIDGYSFDNSIHMTERKTQQKLIILSREYWIMNNNQIG